MIITLEYMFMKNKEKFMIVSIMYVSSGAVLSHTNIKCFISNYIIHRHLTIWELYC